MRELLLEIGVEEVPARFLPEAVESLRALAEGKLASRNISFSEINVFGTPKRLAFMAEGLPETQADTVKEVIGPPKKAAFDESGSPTKAALGFAKSLGIGPEKLIVKARGGGEYVAAVIEEKGQPLRNILPDMLREIVVSLSFPKSMRWGEGSLRFVRPIRWLMALFDFEIVEFEIDGIKSSNITRGHRFLSPVAFQIREARSYRKLLETSFVIADQQKRRSMIEADLAKLSSSVGGKPVEDEELISTVVNLVEYPVGVLCEFPSEYLELPEELLITVMKDHQKYFAIREERSERLLNHFIVISNTLRENSYVVRAGSERVIKARFEDARFYYRDDLKKSLSKRVGDLKKIMYHEKLGSLYDKTERLEKLASRIAVTACPEVEETARRAARLSKADLASGAVKEFPELQGTMGKYYALHEGQPEAVAAAIEEQYLPKHTGGALPATRAGAVLSLADRLDNIASFFYLGLVPSGSEDPFALRRQAITSAMILINGEYDLPMDTLIEGALKGLGQEKNEALKSDITRFVLSRLPQIFEAKGFEPDAIDSVLPLCAGIPLKDIVQRLEAIRRFRKSASYSAFLLAIKRVKNIIPGAEAAKINTGLFKEESESLLYASLQALGKKVEGMLAGHLYEEAIEALCGLCEPINKFFDNVLVMDKDESVKKNRLALLGAIWSLAAGVCDFSRLSEA